MNCITKYYQMSSYYELLHKMLAKATEYERLQNMLANINVMCTFSQNVMKCVRRQNEIIRVP